MDMKKKLPHYHVAAAVIRKGDSFLITQRLVNDKFGGLWEFPGGKQEQDESLEECLIREIFEELNLQILIKTYLFSIEHNYKQVRITLHVFHCQLNSGTPENKGVQSWRWVDFSTVKDYKLTAADENVVGRMEGQLDFSHVSQFPKK